MWIAMLGKSLQRKVSVSTKHRFRNNFRSLRQWRNTWSTKRLSVLVTRRSLSLPLNLDILFRTVLDCLIFWNVTLNNCLSSCHSVRLRNPLTHHSLPKYLHDVKDTHRPNEIAYTERELVITPMVTFVSIHCISVR